MATRIIKRYAPITIGIHTKEYPVYITSRAQAGPGCVYVRRFIESRREWSKRVWHIRESSIRVVEIYRPQTLKPNNPRPTLSLYWPSRGEADMALKAYRCWQQFIDAGIVPRSVPLTHGFMAREVNYIKAPLTGASLPYEEQL
jgi:hypothetical protein